MDSGLTSSSAASATPSAAVSSTHEFDVWKCGSCIVVDESGADIPLKLFARMGRKGKPFSEHELALFGVTKDACYGNRESEQVLRPAVWPKNIDYWKALAKIMERRYPCHQSKRRAYQEQGDACKQALVENDPRCCVATFVDGGAGQSPSIRLALGFQGRLQMYQAGEITIKCISKEGSKGTLFAEHMARNLNSYQAVIADKIASVNELEARNVQLEKQVKALLNQKEETEKTLYAKFLCVLNEKKRKIRELEDEAESGRTTAGGSPLRDYGDGGDDSDEEDDSTQRRTRSRRHGMDVDTSPTLHRTATLASVESDTTGGTNHSLSQLATIDSPSGSMGPPPPAFARGGAGGSTDSGSRCHRSSDPTRDLLDDM